MRQAILTALLAVPAAAQPIPPWNLEVHPGVAVAQVVRWQYNPALLLMWQPKNLGPVFTLHPTGKQITMVLRETGISHLASWVGQCPIRLQATGYWPGLEAIWRSPDNPLIEFTPSPNAPRLFLPASFRVEYGNAWGTFPNCNVGGVLTPVPEWVGMLFELRGL